MKLDILAFGAHPDDVELSCSGTLINAVAAGKKVGVIDFTRGEMGTRGTAGQRAQEAQDAAKIMGLSVREQMGFRDGFFLNDESHQLALIKMIRTYQPDVVLANAIKDRHPDHGRAAELAREACFKAGLQKVVTTDEEGNEQAAWRPRTVYHYIQSIPHTPDFIVDVSDAWETKIKAIKAYKTQFFDPESTEHQTYISSPRFLEMIISRAVHWGHEIGAKHGEGFTVERTLGVSDIQSLL